jgi:hypothetical protein
MTIRPVGAELQIQMKGRTDGRTDGGRTDRQKDITELIVAFRNFANARRSTKGHMTFRIISNGCNTLTCYFTKTTVSQKGYVSLLHLIKNVYIISQ